MMGTTKEKTGQGEEEEESNHLEANQNGGPTRLPAKGGGQQERPGKAEPLVGWEEGRNQRPQTQLEPVLGGVLSPSVVAPPG